MLWFLRTVFAVVFISMVGVTSWASLHTPLSEIPAEVFSHPWFIASLVDAYWGFVTFFVWVAWKEPRAAARGLWFIAIMLLGNLAMSLYLLRELFAIQTSTQLHLVVSRRNPGALILPGILVGLSAAIYAFA